MSIRRVSNILHFTAAFLIFCALAGPTFAKDKPATWREIGDALLRVNDAPVKEWGVFQTGKKIDPLLVRMNGRFLLIRIHDREIFEVDSKNVERKADDLLWDPKNHSAQPLDISDWDASDMEAVFRIRARITAEDRLLDIELPHQLDLSGMSPHNASSSRHR
ncbi:MAG TPA: hypothetical protein VFE02_20245 [Candidatus Acidoferrales bacterium]|jgi:hypothetical protein|nr:hypothetical protein [Candidatus Acidoferrales bacterium]